MSIEKKIMACLCALAVFATAPAVAGKTNFSELEKETLKIATGDKNAIDSDHWVYTNLKTISKKYGLLIDPSENKLNGNSPLTRNEAAVLLVNLTGKIEQDRVELTEAEKTRIEILKSELNKELTSLAGRIEKLETSVTNLEAKKTVGFAHAESLKLMGAIQAQYTGNFGKGLDRRASNFSIPVVDISLKGKIHDHLDFFINTFPSRNYDSAANGTLGDVWLSTDIVPNSRLYIGQKRKPLGMEGMQSPYTLETIERAQIARKLGDKRDSGLTLIGSVNCFDYATGVYNGSGINSTDSQNSDMEYALMATINPLYKFSEYGTLKLGGVYDHGKTTYTNNLYGFVGQYKSSDKKFLLQGEALKKDGYLAASQKASGWYLHTSYFFTDKLQLLARFDRFDQNLSGAQDVINEYTLGSNYYFSNHNLKLMTDLVYVQNKQGSDSRRVLVKTQYRF